jgi:ketosteroid isomerase-like protein
MGEDGSAVSSERNIQSLRNALRAYNARDIDAFIAYCDPSVEAESAFAEVGGGVYRGHDGLRSWHRDLQSAWGGEIRLEDESFYDLGERTLSFHVMHGRGEHSGVEVAMPIAVVVDWRDGLMVHWKAYAHREDALRELGLSKDELEPIAP